MPEQRPMIMRRIAIDRIKLTAAQQAAQPSEGLQESIEEIGMLEPIGVDGKLHLVFGARRLKVCRALGWEEVHYVEVTLEGLRAQMATVHENLCRGELTALERAQLTDEAKRLYEALHPQTKAGAAQGEGKRRSEEARRERKDSASRVTPSSEKPVTAPTFVADTAAKTGRSERAVERDAKIGATIDPVAAEDLKGTTAADSKRQLLDIAGKDPEEQRRIAAEQKRLADEARAAKARGEKPPKKPRVVVTADPIAIVKRLSSVARAVNKVGSDFGLYAVTGGYPGPQEKAIGQALRAGEVGSGDNFAEWAIRAEMAAELMTAVAKTAKVISGEADVKARSKAASDRASAKVTSRKRPKTVKRRR